MPATDFSLTGKTALVTGATSGIGRATAVRLAADGALVLVHGRSPERGAEVVEAVLAAGGQARFLAADLTTADGPIALAADAGAVDILVNNAGSSWFGPTPDLDLPTYDAMFDGNVRATYLLGAALIPGMADRGTGSVINLASMAGTIGMAGGAAYGATKAAVASLARHWAAEYGARGVRANAVAPGPVNTRPEDSAFFDQLGATTPLGRASTPDEIAELIAFLASDRASYVTGATLAADGGRAAV